MAAIALLIFLGLVIALCTIYSTSKERQSQTKDAQRQLFGLHVAEGLKCAKRGDLSGAQSHLEKGYRVFDEWFDNKRMPEVYKALKQRNEIEGFFNPAVYDSPIKGLSGTTPTIAVRLLRKFHDLEKAVGELRRIAYGKDEP